jgi:hypothetical protein
MEAERLKAREEDPTGPLHWGPDQEDAFQKPALALPDITHPFHLYIHKKEVIGLDVLTQSLGPWKQPVAYLSKK